MCLKVIGRLPFHRLGLGFGLGSGLGLNPARLIHFERLLTQPLSLPVEKLHPLKVGKTFFYLNLKLFVYITKTFVILELGSCKISIEK